MKPYSRLAWTNDEGGEGGPVTTVTFEEKGGKTLVVLRESYPSKEALDAAGTGCRMQCSRRSISWTSFSSPWVRASDGMSPTCGTIRTTCPRRCQSALPIGAERTSRLEPIDWSSSHSVLAIGCLTAVTNCRALLRLGGDHVPEGNRPYIRPPSAAQYWPCRLISCDLFRNETKYLPLVPQCQKSPEITPLGSLRRLSARLRDVRF